MIKTILVLSNGKEIMAGYNQENAIQMTSIEESCNDGDDLTFGSVCSKKISVNIITPKNKLQIKAGEKITLYEEENGVRRKKGVFNAEKPQIKNSNTTNIVAYDNISLLDIDLYYWFKSLPGFPFTAYEMAKKVCERCGLKLSNEYLPNGDFLIREINIEKITGRQIIKFIGEICGCFCIADNNGDITYRWYQKNDRKITSRIEENSTIFLKGSLSYEDYSVKKIDAVRINRGESYSIVQYPNDIEEDKNIYIINSNPFLNVEDDKILKIAENLYEKLNNVSYTPCRVSIPSSFYFSIGDIVEIEDANGIKFSTYFMLSTRNGLIQQFQSFGNYERNGATILYKNNYDNFYRNHVENKNNLLETKKDISRVEGKIPTKTSQLTNDSNFATTNQIPDVTGFATENFVKNEIANAQLGGDDSEIDLSGYATKDELKAVENKIPDISDLATKDELEDVESKIPDTSNLATKQELSNLATQIPTKTSDLENDSNFATKEDISTATKDLATKEEVSKVEEEIPKNTSDLTNDSGYMTESEVEKLVDDKLSTIEVENGSVVYDRVVDEERKIYYAIDTNYLARNGSMSLKDQNTREGLEIRSVMSTNGATFPLIIESKRGILEIVIVTENNDKLTVIDPPRGSFENVRGSWVFTPLEGDDVTMVNIVSASNKDVIVQLLVITA